MKKITILIITLSLILIIGIITITFKNITYVDENTYYNNIKNIFLTEINSEPTPANYLYNSQKLYLPNYKRLYNKTDQSFTVYYKNTPLNIMIIPESIDSFNFQTEYNNNIIVVGELVVDFSSIDESNPTFLYIYKLEDQNYYVTMGMNHIIISFETKYKNLAKITEFASKIINHTEE